jgi:hypothetical protein
MLEDALGAVFRGADASFRPDSAAQDGTPNSVVWQDHGSELLVHLDTMHVELRAGHVAVSLQVETRESQAVTQDIDIAIADDSEPPNFVAASSLVPGGHPALAERWGPLLQRLVWQTVVDVADAQANGHAIGLAATAGSLIVHQDMGAST